MTRITLASKQPKPKKPALSLVFCLENQTLPLPEESRSVAASEGFKGAKDKSLLLPAGKSTARTLAWGLGKAADLDRDALRRAAGAAAKRCRDLKAGQVELSLPTELPKGCKEADAVAAVAEGIWLSLYKFDKFKSKPKDGEEGPKDPEFGILAGPKSKDALEEARIACESVCLARDWVNTPPNVLNPETYSRIAAGLVKQGKSLSIKVYDRKQLDKMGAGGIVGVGKGSDVQPKLVHLHYKPSRRRRTVALVGKGVTFDSGGLSIKTGSYMQDMKSDMGGSAAALAACLAASRLGLPVEIHAIAPMVENMPSGGALRVDDVVTFLNGKTAEIMNTDAEGRVILADALAYASSLKPDLIVDFATLTGAAIVALGMNITAMMGDDKLAARMKAAGEKAGEMMWQLPLPKAYRSHIDSRVADIKNTGNSGEAGTIAGAMFLREFVDEKIPWLHCDIAGPAYLKKDDGVHPSGATGTPVRTVLEFLKSL